MSEPLQDDTSNTAPKKSHENTPFMLYRVVFRKKGQVSSCFSKITNLALDENIMVQTDHGLEPAIVFKQKAAKHQG